MVGRLIAYLTTLHRWNWLFKVKRQDTYVRVYTTSKLSFELRVEHKDTFLFKMIYNKEMP
jgi:hypothetical protein